MPTRMTQLAGRLDGLAGHRGPTRRQLPRGRDLLLRLADQAPATTSEEAAQLLHGVLSAVKRGAISETFAGRLIDRLVPKAVAARTRPTVTLDLPEITDAGSYAAAQAAVLRALAAGELTPAEAKATGGVLAETWNALRVAERHRRMAAWRS